jgi:Large polyvalent protein-associated domain 11
MSESTNKDEFNYMMLGRLHNDVVQFFAEDSFSYQKEENLWALNKEDQIEEMKKIHNQIDEKPEWLTMEEIEAYEEKFKGVA